MHLTFVAFDADAPGVTHIVYPFGPNGDPDDGLQYMRKLTSRFAELNFMSLIVLMQL